MKSNYKKLGGYIRLVDKRNKDLSITNLLGVSIEKHFIPSIANIIGTDLSSYKVVQTGQFAYGPVTSRNGEKISIAYLDGEDCIISSSYTVFEVVDKNELDPEYLMLWFSRPEFDRYARYKSHGSVREIFDWDELCMVELPVPDIEEQRTVVKAYKTITDRIALKKQINDNLTAQLVTLQRQTFPISDDKENNMPLSNYCKKIYSGGTPSTTEDSYWNGGYPWLSSGETSQPYITRTEKTITVAGIKNSSTKLAKRGSIVIASAGQGLTRGQTSLLMVDTYVNQSVIVIEPKDHLSGLLYSNLKGRYDEMRVLSDLDSIRGSLTTKTVSSLPVCFPNLDIAKSFSNHCEQFFELINNNLQEIEMLIVLKNTIISSISSR